MNAMNAMNKKILLPIGCCLAIFAGLALGLYTDRTQRSTKLEISGFAFPEPEPLADVELIGQNNETITVEDFRDNWTFVYVGYTYCPDACPISLSTMNQTQALIDESDGQTPQMMLVSVDPERDTPERLAEYVAYFNPDFKGATGTPENLQNFADQTRAIYSLPDDRSSGEYLVDHSSSIVLINPDAAVHAIFTPPQSAEKLAEDFTAIVAAYR
jgi:protein SCO1/2